MANIDHFGPYYFSPNEGLAPGEVYNMGWGPFPKFGKGTIHVTAHPNGRLRQVYVARMRDISVKTVITGSGDLNYYEYYAYVTIENSGQVTIENFTAYITVTTD